jgi:hypothetical protein
MKTKHLLPMLRLLTLTWLVPWSAQANLVADWGTIPTGSETSFTFVPDTSVSNFTDEYRFTLSGMTDINYVAADYLAACTRGCGNPVVDFGIYNASGSLVDSTGTTTLDTGSYVFQIKGVGMGSGNTAGSGGVITFYGAAPELVSPAPVPASWLLMSCGLALLGWAVRRRVGKSAE